MKAWVSGEGDLYSREGVKTKVNRPVYTCAKYNGTLIMKPFSDELKAIVQEILQEQKPSETILVKKNLLLYYNSCFCLFY